jgi:hypothetical protein
LLCWTVAVSLCVFVRRFQAMHRSRRCSSPTQPVFNISDLLSALTALVRRMQTRGDGECHCAGVTEWRWILTIYTLLAVAPTPKIFRRAG